MGYLTKYGSLWGQIPQTPGQIFWVAPAASYTVDGIAYTASDDNDGLSPARAKLTVDATIGVTTANVGDVIVLLPGAHSTAAVVTVDVAGITITGMPGSAPLHGSRSAGGPNRNRASVTNTATAGFIFTVSSDDVEIAWLDLRPVTAGGRGIYAAAGADRLYVHDCTFSMIAVAATSTYGIVLGTLATGVVEDTVIRNCLFISGSSAESSANGAGVSVITTAYGLTIEQCTFSMKGTAAWLSAIDTYSAGTTNCVIRDCDFLNSSTAATEGITTAITSTSTIDGALQVFRCYVSAGTDVATASAIVDIVLAETYLASAGGGALANNN